jgi:hypothetical protein
LKILILAAALSVSTVTATDASSPSLPAIIVEHEYLLLRGVRAEVGQTGIQVRGWVRRDMSSYGPISAHLHVEALAGDGQTLRTIEASWRGELPSLIRYRRAAIFRAVLPYDEATTAVRVSIADGPRHPTS